MPALSPTMTEGGIARWEKKEGESFSAGDLLLQIETDKAQMDVEAQDDGVLVKILQPEGTQNVAVNTPIAIIAEEGDDIEGIDISALLSKGPPKETQAKEPPAAAEASATATTPAAAPPSSSGDNSAHGLLSPAVMFAVHSNHIANVGDIAGSGPKGRILKGDVIRFLKEGKAVIDKSKFATPAKESSATTTTTDGVSAKTAPSSKAAKASSPASTSGSSADAETAFLVRSLEPSVLRHLAEVELAKKSVTVQVAAEKLAKLLKSNKALSESAFAVRAAALAVQQTVAGGDASVGVAVDGAKEIPRVVEIPNASTTSVIDLAASIRNANSKSSAASQAAGNSTPTVVVAGEGLYRPDTLPKGSVVVVVGKPHSAVSAAAATAALDSALDELIGSGAGPANTELKAQPKTAVIDVSVIGEAAWAGAFAGKVKGLLSNPELLTL
ncbi:pyridoxine biosynthesis protein [Coemansia sp. RSA 2049]|nr:pyridoxine biosynthesis protein [Coemansia sp. RSA 2049]